MLLPRGQHRVGRPVTRRRQQYDIGLRRTANGDLDIAREHPLKGLPREVVTEGHPAVTVVVGEEPLPILVPYQRRGKRRAAVTLIHIHPRTRGSTVTRLICLRLGTGNPRAL